MIAPLTPNAQAILLLTAPLIVGRNEGSPDLLTLTEYNRLARILREKQKQPADLIGPDAVRTVGVCAGVFGRERLESLLGRGFLLSQAVDHWNARAIWVVSRADATYPRRLKAPGEGMAGEAGRGRRAGEVCTMKKPNAPSLTQQAMQALTDAVAKVVADHRQRGRPLAVWRDGKAVWIPAKEAGALLENPTPCRAKSHAPKS
jgi:hypothetical protein